MSLSQIHTFVTESFIQFGNSFVSSTSDFWHHPVWKTSFGASVSNFMANGYQFKNGLFLAVPQTTLPSVISEDLIRSEIGTLHRCQALLDFCMWTQPKTGELIGNWLEECHNAVGCKPSYIASHIVDGAANAAKSVKSLEWNTSQARSQKIVADGCDAHKINTIAGIASGTSKHAENMNPNLGKNLALLHIWLGRFFNYKAYQDELSSVQKQNGREATPRVQRSVVTRWNSSFDETASANANQHDLDIAIRRIVVPGGVRERVRVVECREEEGGDKYEVISDDCWNMYAQYEGAMLPVKRYSKACQTARVIVHEELFWARSVIEELKAPFFVMHKNVSASIAAKNLKVSGMCAVAVILFGLLMICSKTTISTIDIDNRIDHSTKLL